MGLIRILAIGFAAVLAYSIFRKFLSRPSGRGNPDIDDDRLGRLVQDPQCQVYVDSREAIQRSVPGGDLFFCSEECAEEYINSSRPGKPEEEKAEAHQEGD